MSNIKKAIEQLEWCADEECYWAIQLAIKALKEKQKQEDAASLTLIQLKECIDKPIYHYYDQNWYIIDDIEESEGEDEVYIVTTSGDELIYSDGAFYSHEL